MLNLKMMVPINQRPVRERKIITLAVTIFVGLVLIVVMIINYSGKKKEGHTNNDSSLKISDFYSTIVENAQSAFKSK